MSTRDHYNDVPHQVPDAVRDGRQLMQQPDRRVEAKRAEALERTREGVRGEK